ncbi:glial cell line-derived neurotrophic factor-like [Gadus morhua]|uniref:glial cell line-derived neurotrophic factor-like n=1 Tax=Gadus morhua TaxID=8049 RepID=UPI0011B584BC|nr:glial cell line-derived neurotrophic factor-like [Gadus morhua]
MKLWDSLTTCLFLLSSVHTSPRTQPRRPPPSTSDPPERPLETPPVKIRLSINPAANTRVFTDRDDLERMADTEQSAVEERLAECLDGAVDAVRVTVSRKPRSASQSASPSPSPSSSPSTPPPNARVNLSSRARHRRGRKTAVSERSSRGGRGGGGGGGAKGARRRNGKRGRGGQGCMLKQIHLNVTDLGLGYQSEEEMIFRYCSGPCRKSETNYDKILHNIAHDRRLGARDAPPNPCCRPIAFDDNLSFLDDNLVYHTIRKHSARKCGCV